MFELITEAPIPAPYKPIAGKEYRLKARMRIYIRSPRFTRTRTRARWVAAVVKHWDNKSRCWIVKVVAENLVESWWTAPLIEGRWKPRQKLTHREKERKARGKTRDH